MNKLSIITAFLGSVKNRYMVYQNERTLAQKLKLASQVDGCNGVEVCYPDDFNDPKDLKHLLNERNLETSAVNFRSRRSGKWWRGSFTSVDAKERQEVVDDLKRAIDYAAELGCNRVTTCPLNEGVDNVFEVDYAQMYDHAAETLSSACAHNRKVRLCLEYKKNDPRAHGLFNSAGETAAFCLMVGADNLGVTLDVGHSLQADEFPALAATMLSRAGKLFYVHLNDNDGRWDWDMLPGAYHIWEFIELFHVLRKLNYDNDWFSFDVFPKEVDTLETYNAAMFLTRKLESIAHRLDQDSLKTLYEKRNPARTIPYLFSLLS